MTGRSDMPYISHQVTPSWMICSFSSRVKGVPKSSWAQITRQTKVACAHQYTSGFSEW